MPDPRRHLADLLSAGNAFFGVASCFFALQGRADVSLVLLMAGAVCDGLDGAAARRFGGTRFGVLADDVADAISCGVAPAIAVAVVTSGVEGTAVGVVYGALTIARLAFFTLRKGLPGEGPPRRRVSRRPAGPPRTPDRCAPDRRGTGYDCVPPRRVTRRTGSASCPVRPRHSHGVTETFR